MAMILDKIKELYLSLRKEDREVLLKELQIASFDSPYLEKRYRTTWTKSFRSMLLQAEQLKKRFGPADHSSPNQARDNLGQELDALLEEPLNQKHKELVTFPKRTAKHRDCIFTFLYNPDVPPDNNGSERAIRNVKVKQKISPDSSQCLKRLRISPS